MIIIYINLGSEWTLETLFVYYAQEKVRASIAKSVKAIKRIMLLLESV